MNFKKYIPNLLTLLNLLSGVIAVYFAVKEQLILAAYFVFLGIFFDFFDGFAARVLKVSSDLGKQLDSLADVVTSGVVPGLVMFQLIANSVESRTWYSEISFTEPFSFAEVFNSVFLISIIGLFITLAAAYRLAKFNIDERQTNSFIGLPTPAAALVVLALPLILNYSSNEVALSLISNSWFLVGITFLLCYLMNAEIPLFSLKFKELSWKNQKVKYIFIVIALILAIAFQFIAIPIIVLLYVLMSIIENAMFKTEVLD